MLLSILVIPKSTLFGGNTVIITVVYFETCVNSSGDEVINWRFGFNMFSNCFLPELDPNPDLNAYTWTHSK